MANIISYRYKVLNSKGNYEEWTGTFKQIQDAKKWFRMFGTFHEYRGFKLQLFGKCKHSNEIAIN